MHSSCACGSLDFDSLDLKVMLLTEGICIHDEVHEAYGVSHRLSRDPLECSALFLLDGTVVHIADVGPAAPFQVTLDPEGKAVLSHRGACVSEVTFPRATAFYRQQTSRGIPFRGMAVLQGHDVLSFPYLWPCEFAKAGMACKFCHCGNYTQYQAGVGVPADAVFTPRDVAEAVHYAVNVERCARYIQITGGSTLETNGECGRILELLHAIEEVAGLKNIPGELILYTTPPADPKEIDALFDAGADRISCDIEIWNEELFRRICPGKARWTGRQRALDTLLHIAETHGPARACSTFVVGLEPAEDFLAGAEFLAQRGIPPIPSIWMPHGLPAPPSPVKADLAFFRKVKRGLAEIYEKHNCQPPGDRGFNVCLCRDTWNHRGELISKG